MWFAIAMQSIKPQTLRIGRTQHTVTMRPTRVVDHVYVGRKGDMSVAERLTALVERHPDRYVRITASRPRPTGKPASYATASAMLRR
jgi:hypothetical protein